MAEPLTPCAFGPKHEPFYCRIHGDVRLALTDERCRTAVRLDAARAAAPADVERLPAVAEPLTPRGISLAIKRLQEMRGNGRGMVRRADVLGILIEERDAARAAAPSVHLNDDPSAEHDDASDWFPIIRCTECGELEVNRVHSEGRTGSGYHPFIALAPDRAGLREDIVDIIEQAIFETDTGLAAAMLAADRLAALLSEPVPAGLDVERLARAIDAVIGPAEDEEGCLVSTEEVEGIAAEYAGLAETPE